MSPVLCQCCGEEMDVGVTPKQKPYLRCDPCGIQTFIRGRRGVQFFDTKYGTGWRGEASGGAPAPKPEPKATPAPKPKAPPKPEPEPAAAGATEGGKRARGPLDF